MPVIRAIAIAASLAVAAGGAAAQPRCAPAPSPRVLFTLQMKPAELSHALSSAELRRDRGDSTTDRHALGQYRADLAQHSELSYRTAQTGDLACIAVERVHVVVELTTRVIHVARDLDRASCRYRVTLEHERQHEQIDETFLRERLPREVQALRGEFGGLATRAPVRASESDRALAEIRARLKAITDRMFDRVFAERAAAQAAIDTQDEYDRITALCP